MRFLSFGGFQNTAATNVEEVNPTGALGSPYKEHNLAGLRLIKDFCNKAFHDPEFGRKERDAYHSDTIGALPTGLTGHIIVLSCNPTYFHEFGKNFIASHFKTLNTSHIHIHLTLPDPATISDLDIIFHKLGADRFSYSVSNSMLPRNLVYPGVYLTCARFIHTHSIMMRNDATCINLDIDGIFRKPITSFVNDTMLSKDLALIRRFTRIKPSRKVLASALICAKTPSGERFQDALSRALVRILMEGPQYHVDQTVLHYLERTARKAQLRTALLKLELADHRFEDNSPVWTAKGRRKNDPRFIELAIQSQRDYDSLMAG